jgi:hypothetical protein
MKQLIVPTASGWRYWLRQALFLALTFVAGIGIGPVACEHLWFRTSDLSIEVISVIRTIPDEPLVNFDNEPDLADLESTFKFRIWRNARAGNQLTPTELDQFLMQAGRQLQNNKKELQAREAALDEVRKLSPSEITRSRVAALNGGLPAEKRVEYFPVDDNGGKPTSYQVGAHRALITAYDQHVKETKRKVDAFEENLAAAQTRAECILSDLEKTHAHFVVTAALSNSGGASTSVKQPALLRVYLSGGNHFDIKLLADDYAKVAQIEEKGTTIIAFRSKRLASFTEEDGELVNEYWGKNAHAVLFVEDMLGDALASSRIPFAEGLYQRQVHDRLANEASRPVYL